MSSAHPYSTSATLTITGSKLPWASRLLGVGWYTSRSEALDDIPPVRFGWKLFWRGCEVSQVFSQSDTYRVRFHADGLFRVHTSGMSDRFFAVVYGEWKELDNPLPKDFEWHMRKQNCSYEEVWSEAWDDLCRQHEATTERRG
jgi:hypothetical protein